MCTPPKPSTTIPACSRWSNGTIYVPGGKGDVGYFGGLITHELYENYRLRFEFKWGEHTYGRRKNKARDAGVMLHCIGANGPGPWMTSYECHIIEGGTGDLLLVNPLKVNEASLPFTLTCRAESERRGTEWCFKDGAKRNGLKEGERLDWWGRDPHWKDVVDYRGPSDADSPVGQWTRCEIVARGNTLEYYVNDKLVNRGSDLNVCRGKILLQTEGAEVWYRNIELTKLMN